MKLPQLKSLWQKKPKFYTSLDECPVLVFFKIMETGNTNLLYYENARPEPLIKVWEYLVKEYLEATKNNSVRNNQMKRNTLLKMVVKYEILCNAFVMACCDDFWESKNLTDQLGYNFKLYDIESIQRKLLEVKSAIDLKTSELIKLNSTQDSKKAFNIYETLLILGQFAGYKIDAKQTSTTEFIQISEAYKKHKTQVEQKQTKK